MAQGAGFFPRTAKSISNYGKRKRAVLRQEQPSKRKGMEELERSFCSEHVHLSVHVKVSISDGPVRINNIRVAPTALAEGR